MTAFFWVTVDTEAGRGRSFDKWVVGKTEFGEFGVSKIIGVCDNYRVRATFFVDVYEVGLYGEDPVRSVCRQIVDAKHECQLHTHPANLNHDWSRQRMSDYSLREQEKIIREGLDLIEKYAGVRPIAHRAGAYGVDSRTLSALVRNAMVVDSSYFYSYNTFDKGFVMPRTIGRLTEVPVTVFGARLGRLPVRPILKLDLDWLPLRELLAAAERLVQVNSIIVLFLHGDSLTRTLDEKGNSANVDKLESLLAFLNSRASSLVSEDIARMSPLPVTLPLVTDVPISLRFALSGFPTLLRRTIQTQLHQVSEQKVQDLPVMLALL